MALPKPASCQGCPAATVGKGFVPGVGKPDATMMVLGSGPTSDEFLNGTPFTGYAERRWNYWCSQAGVDQTRLAVAHVVWCQLPYEKGAPRKPTAAEVEHCRKTHWGAWLAQFNPKVRVTLGVPALKALVGPWADSNDIGNLVGTAPEPPTIGLQTFGYITGGNWSEEPAQVKFLRYANDIATGVVDGYAQRPDFTRPPPGVAFDFAPTLASLAAWRSALPDPAEVVVDIETAGDHIRLVGLYDVGGRSYLGFPIRSVGGGNYWGTADLPLAVEWLWDLLSDELVAKVFHNGQAFDIPMLERNGFVVEGYEYDTMLAAHVAYPGVPKGLEELAKVHLRAGGWKRMVKGDVGEELDK